MVILSFLGIFLGIIVTFFFSLTFLISKNLRKLRRNINFNYSHLEVHFQKRNNEVKEIISLCKSLKKYNSANFKKVEDLLEEISLFEEKKEDEIYKNKTIFSFEPELDKELTDLLALLYQKHKTLKTNNDFLRNRMRLSQQQTALKKTMLTYNEEAEIYNIRLKQFPDSLFAKRLSPYKPI